ncbi:MAG: phosphocholine cytidylyltransferase family protein [Deltaproteobacteria bacterium]|nr:phosphocholine cytidylyltransferase family protein [Deltaproteobacteria bacterium]
MTKAGEAAWHACERTPSPRSCACVKPTAIILAAGVGRRFGAELGERPKALLQVRSETLLGRLVRQLRATGVERIVIVVGWGAEHIEALFAGAAGVEILRNPDYRRGAILSLWTARKHLEADRPVLVMDADVFGPDEMIARLVGSAHESCFLLDGSAEATGEEQMLMVRGERVVDIARVPRGAYDQLGESIGFLRLSAEASRVLLGLLAERVERGDVDLEHEEVYPELLARVEVGFEPADDLAWTEIDFPEDLERARALAVGTEEA